MVISKTELNGPFQKAKGKIFFAFHVYGFCRNSWSTLSQGIANCEISYNKFCNKIWIASIGKNGSQIAAIKILNELPKINLVTAKTGNSTVINFQSGLAFNVENVTSKIDDLLKIIDEYDFNEINPVNKNEMFIMLAFLIFESNKLLKAVPISNIADRFSYVTKDLKLFDYIKEPTFNNSDIENNNIFLFDVSNIDYFKSNIAGFLMELFTEKQLNNTNTVHFLIDEAHYYCNREEAIIKDETSKRTLKLFEKIAKEGRKFGNFLILSSQRPSDIKESIFSQFGTFFIHRLISDNDIEMINKFLLANTCNIFENTKAFSPGECILMKLNFPFLQF